MTPILELDREALSRFYDREADRYLAELPLEHFMEATPHATQREITLESFALIRTARPDIHVFNELLVLYPESEDVWGPLAKVVPDNVVVLYLGSIDANKSYNLRLQPIGPILVLEYVSEDSTRKDYEDNFERYKRDLKVKYYLLFDPQIEQLKVWQLLGGEYIPVAPNAAGRLAIPELDLEAGLLDGWTRFWVHGELLPLPAELLAQRDADRRARSNAEGVAAEDRRARTAAELVLA